MPDKMKGAESATTTTERRASQRVRASSLMYVELGDGNGGIVSWISEGGLALVAAGILKGREPGDELGKMQIQLPEFWGAIEATGRIAWKSQSGKEAGVRFVDLGVEARDRIRKWIAAQTRKNNAEVELPELPKMQLPTKKRGSRFSFADVASSRVGAGEEGRAGHEPDSSPQIERNTFDDASEAVASAFESTTCIEEHKAEALSDRGETRILSPPEEARQRRSPSPFPERRSYLRRPILLFTYAVLGDDNGGLVFNLGEGGLALTAAAGLRDSHFRQMRVRLPDSQDEIDTKGRLAWISDSGKEAGIEFVDLAEDVRTRIRRWVALGEPEADSQIETAKVRTIQNLPSALPCFEERKSPAFAPVPRESTPASEDRLKALVASRSALFTCLKGVLARAAVKRRVAKIKPPKPARRPKLIAKPRGRLAQKALVLAAALALFAAGWFFREQTHWNDEASSVVTQNIPSAEIPSESKQKSLVAPERPAKDSPIWQNENGTPQADTPKPLENLSASVDSAVKRNMQTQTHERLQPAPAMNATPPYSVSPIKQKNHPTRDLEPERRRSAVPAPNRLEESRITENKFVENKPAESKPVENKPVQTAEVLPAPNKELNAALPPSNATPTRPEASTLSKEKEASPVAAKHPEIPVPRTAVVTVTFDPYPSIRMPQKESSKKSQQGKSLQMGTLVQRVDPVYPEDAKQQGIEGTVKLHVIFSREGAVESLILVSGPPLLVRAAADAVRQWRYSPTVLNGQAMETEEDVTVVFRLSNGAQRSK